MCLAAITYEYVIAVERIWDTGHTSKVDHFLWVLQLHNPEKVVDFWSAPYNRPIAQPGESGRISECAVVPYNRPIAQPGESGRLSECAL